MDVIVVLTGIEIWTKRNELVLSHNSSITLNNFNIYANEFLSPKYSYDAVHLLTKKRFGESHLGLAKKMTICHKNLAVGVQTLVSWTPEYQASTFAHELGHNLGMDHDQKVPDCRCEAKGKDCIMNAEAKSNSLKRVWSSCSIDRMKEAFKNGFDVCLYDVKKPPKELSSCGNGILDDGEECDCGLEKYCKNPCCNPQTCKKHDSAQCASGECCNLLTCQIKQAGATCRPSTGSCDLTEKCDGKSEECPEENHAKDYLECENRNYCFKSKCPSRDAQCQKIFGEKSMAMSENECFFSFSYGTEVKNVCDKLRCFCDRYCPILDYYSLFSRRKSGNCTYFSRNEDSQFGISSEGVRCGNGMVCSNSQCVNIDFVKKAKNFDVTSNIDQISDGSKSKSPSTVKAGENWQNYLIVGAILMILVVTCLLIKCNEKRVTKKNQRDAAYIGEKLAYAPQFVKNPHAKEKDDEFDGERHQKNKTVEVKALVHTKRNTSF